ncbi:MAG: hypothetical protein F9K32_02205 [Desulfobulbaceae bacterium]|nr:MAG: hypothetical protein F9K32_02205 [Desulfobulbaceae bacterium]
MKVSTFRAILFIILFFLIDQIIFNIYKFEHNDQAYSYGALSKLYSGTINSDIVIFGSSRTMLHLDPAIIAKNTGLSAYNLAKDGTNIYQSFFTLKEYLIYNSKPRLIIFEADINQLDLNNKLRFEKDKFKEYSYISKNVADLFVPSPIERFSQSLVKSQFAANKTSQFYTFITKTIFGNKEKEENLKDFGGWIFSNGAHLKKGTVIEYTTFKESIFQLTISTEKLKLLEMAANLSDRLRIPILFFSPPINYWKRNDSIESGLRAIEKIAFGHDVSNLADYTFDDDFSCDSQYWWNEGHLNIDGARLLSKKLTYDINKLIKVDESGQ